MRNNISHPSGNSILDSFADSPRRMPSSSDTRTSCHRISLQYPRSYPTPTLHRVIDILHNILDHTGLILPQRFIDILHNILDHTSLILPHATTSIHHHQITTNTLPSNLFPPSPTTQPLLYPSTSRTTPSLTPSIQRAPPPPHIQT